MNIISLLFDNIALIGGALVVALLGWFGIRSKMATKRAEEADEHAAEAERQRDEAQGAAATQKDAYEAVEKVRKKPLKRPSAKRDDFEGQ